MKTYAEELMESYYMMKEVNDRNEKELSDDKTEPAFNWDAIVAKEAAKQEDIRRHRNDAEYAKKMLQAEHDRFERLRALGTQKADEKKRLDREQEEKDNYNRQLEYYRELDMRRDEERREEEYRRQQEEEERRREYEYEKQRREEEDRRRRQNEEYYDEMRRRGY